MVKCLARERVFKAFEDLAVILDIALWDPATDHVKRTAIGVGPVHHAQVSFTIEPVYKQICVTVILWGTH